MSTLDERLSRLFAPADAPPDFEVRLMARVRAEETDPSYLRAAREREELTYAAARQGLEGWRRSALRMFSLDAVAGATLLIVLLGSLPRVMSKFGANAPGLVIAAVAVAIAGYLAVPLLKRTR